MKPKIPTLNLGLFFSLFLFISSLHAQSDPQAFITTWRTNNPGLTGNHQIEIPTGPSGVFNYNVNWGDGNSDLNVNGPIVHTYATPGTYTVSITGSFPHLYFNNKGDKEKLLSVNQWGYQSWSSMEGAFHGCKNLFVTANDTPDLTNVTSLRNMFNGTQFNKNIKNWNISNVLDMTGMLSGTNIDKRYYNEMLMAWSALPLQSNVWFDAGNSNYCAGEEARNQLTDKFGWVIYDGGIDCSEPFVSEWEVFDFNMRQITIPTVGGGYNYDVDWGDGTSDKAVKGSITHAYPLSGKYRVSISGDFPRIYFNNSGSKNQIIAVLQWGEVKWQDMTNAFFGCKNLRLLARDAPDLSNVLSLNNMFRNALKMNSITNYGFHDWDVRNIEDMTEMFAGTGLKSEVYDKLLLSWSSQAVKSFVKFDAGNSIYCNAASSRNFLINNLNWVIIDDGLECSRPFVSLWNTENPGLTDNYSILIPTNTSPPSTYNYDIDWGDGQRDVNVNGNIIHQYQEPGVYEVTISGDFPRIFFNDEWDKAKIIEILDWGTGQWNSMGHAFHGCSNLFVSAYEPPDLTNVTDLSFAFKGASSLKEFAYVGSSATNMESMFENATSFNTDVSSWDVSKVTNMRSMFKGASSFKNSIANWEVFELVDATEMFNGVKLPTSVYDEILSKWALKKNLLKSGIVFDAGFSLYCDSEISRNELTNSKNWSISDGGKNCNFNDAFVSIWKSDNPGISKANEISIPISGPGYNYAVEWGDGTADYGLTTGITHQYALPGIYEVSIKGDFPGIFFNNTGDKAKILRIKAWGDINWTSLEHAFYGCTNLVVEPTDTINLAAVTSLKGMFQDVPEVRNINNWNVSTIVDMNAMFKGVKLIGSSLNSWNTQNVVDMGGMFQGCNFFNGQLWNWDVTKVERMNYMFANASNFNSNLTTWYTDNVTNMAHMFENATSFNQNIGQWNVSRANDLSFMFNNATAFDQDIGNWDVSQVTDMGKMFFSAGLSLENYDKLLLGWISRPLMNGVYFDAGDSKFCQGTAARNQMIINYGWKINDGGFGCDLVSSPFITRWKTNNPGVSGDMEITIPTSGGGYNYIVDWGDGKYDGNVNGSITHQYQNMGSYTVSIYGNFPRIYFLGSTDSQKILEIKQWGDIEWSSFSEAFYNCINLTSSAIDAPNLSNVTHTNGMFVNAHQFNGDLSNWNVANVRDMGGMFVNAFNFNSDIGNWNTGNVQTMEQMFASAISFNRDIGNWNVSKVTNMKWMFSNSSSFDQNIGNWDVSNVTDMTGMFQSTGLSNENYDALLLGWSSLSTLKPNVNFDGGNSQYCAGTAGKAVLAGVPNSWIIKDGGQIPNCCPATTTFGAMGWDNGIPDATKNAFFQSNYNSMLDGGSIDACRLHIDPGVTVTIGDGDHLNLKYDLNLKGNLVLKQLATFNSNN